MVGLAESFSSPSEWHSRCSSSIATQAARRANHQHLGVLRGLADQAPEGPAAGRMQVVSGSVEYQQRRRGDNRAAIGR